jgi:hypothetical protein
MIHEPREPLYCLLTLYEVSLEILRVTWTNCHFVIPSGIKRMSCGMGSPPPYLDCAPSRTFAVVHERLEA